MPENTRGYIPAYCHPDNFLPPPQPIEQVFSKPPYLFQDFVGKTLAFLQSSNVRSMGFSLDMDKALPCKWKCADESLFGVDLILYAYTGQYPFDKGSLGGFFNTRSVEAAVHHAPINLDFGGAHVGYKPGPGQGIFGRIPRPLNEAELSPDCGYLCSVLYPFMELYQDASNNILLWMHRGKLALSIPNEYLHPAWSSNAFRLLVDLQSLVQEESSDDPELKKITSSAGRSTFYSSSRFTASVPAKTIKNLQEHESMPLGKLLSSEYFHIFDMRKQADGDDDLPSRLMPYMAQILTNQFAPPELMAAMIHSNLEHNRLTDRIRKPKFRPYSFASFTGIFIDIHDELTGGYINLFQPVGLSIKPEGSSREFEITAEQLNDVLDDLEPVSPRLPLEHVLGYRRPAHILDQFTFTTRRDIQGARSSDGLI